MRFPEFSDEWENKTLKDILKYEQPAKYIVNDKEYLQSGVPVLTANKSFILGYTKENTNIYKKECFIFDDFTLDMKYVNFPFKVKSSAIKIITANKQNNIYFWYNYLKRMDLVSLSHNRHWISEVSLLQAKVPNIDEQTKIADFLSLIDKRIELQIKIIKDYELLKKIINIRMFTHSTKLPILRFPEFNEVWEKTTLGNISNIKIYQPQTIKPLNFGKYKVFGANGYIGYYEEYNHNTNQVTISCRGEKSGTVNFVEPFVWITGNSMVLNLDKTSEIIKKFLYYELISNNVNYLITGSGQPQLTRDSLIQHKIYFPNIDEQSKIANFLSKLDEVLLNVKCEKEKLIKNKTFLLQNLFI